MILRARALLAALAVALTVGCSSTPSTYLRSRAGDFLDAVPVSLSWGSGIGASMRGTSLFHVGVSAWPARSLRFGYDDRRVCGIWREYQIAFPWTVFPEDLVDVPVTGVYELPDGPLAGLPAMPPEIADDLFASGIPIVYRWQSARDAEQGEDRHLRGGIMPDVLHIGRHPSYVRESTGAFLVPEVRHRVHFREVRRLADKEPVLRAGGSEIATAWAAVRGVEQMPSDWDRFEFDVSLLLVGARVGIRPVEFVDFVVGLADFDLLGDDLPEAESFVPGDIPPMPAPPVPELPVEEPVIDDAPVEAEVPPEDDVELSAVDEGGAAVESEGDSPDAP